MSTKPPHPDAVKAAIDASNEEEACTNCGEVPADEAGYCRDCWDEHTGLLGVGA